MWFFIVSVCEMLRRLNWKSVFISSQILSGVQNIVLTWMYNQSHDYIYLMLDPIDLVYRSWGWYPELRPSVHLTLLHCPVPSPSYWLLLMHKLLVTGHPSHWSCLLLVSSHASQWSLVISHGHPACQSSVLGSVSTWRIGAFEVNGLLRSSSAGSRAVALTEGPPSAPDGQPLSPGVVSPGDADHMVMPDSCWP